MSNKDNLSELSMFLLELQIRGMIRTIPSDDLKEILQNFVSYENSINNIHVDLKDDKSVLLNLSSQTWFKNGGQHRDNDKPAYYSVISGCKKYFQNGIFIKMIY